MKNHLQTVHDFDILESSTRAKILEAKAIQKTLSGDENTFGGTIYVVVLDLESTELIKRMKTQPKIIEIGARFLSNENLTFETLVNPKIPIQNSHIHEIYDDMVKHSPDWKCVGKQLVEWVEEIVSSNDLCLFLAHNAAEFDKPLLESELKREGINIPDNWIWGDSLLLFRKLLPKLKVTKKTKPYKLGALYAHYFKQDITNAHTAMGDIEALIKILKHVYPNTDESTTKQDVVSSLYSLQCIVDPNNNN